MAGTIYVNGEFRRDGEAVVNVLDHGLLYGDGVFEGIRAYNGRVFKLEQHLERLFDSAKALRLAIPATPDELAQAVLDTCRRNGIVDGYIRLVVTRGVGDLGIDPRSCGQPQLVIIARPSMVMYRGAPAGVSVITSSFRRPPPDTLCPSIKSLNYVNNVLARMEANDRGADEALLLDVNGFVAEASADNIFIVNAHGLATPPAATNLRGITRETVLEIAAARGLVCVERPFTLFEVWTAREVFICGTGAEVVPVLSVDQRPIGDGTIGPVTATIVAAYAATVRATGTPIDTESGHLVIGSSGHRQNRHLVLDGAINFQ
jgi:branched-chain amino acid aminotransferase